MGFVQATMLAALGAVVLPILAHLIFRRRARPVDLGTLRFLKIAVRHDTRRRTLKRWVLLGLRLSCVVLLVLNHEVVLFQVLDPWERDLPLEGNVRFRDLETGETLTTLSEGVREGYRQAVRQWLTELDRACLSRGIDRVELTTSDPLDRALLDYFVRRSRQQ